MTVLRREDHAGERQRPVAVILAAGAGRRLGDLGKRHSKAMLPLGQRPLIDHVMERLRAAGLTRFVVVAHVEDRELIAFLAARHPHVRVALQKERLGIADAFCRALPLIEGEPGVLACACDSLFLPRDIATILDRAQERPADAVVGVLDMSVADTFSRSSVRLRGNRVCELIEKPAPGASASSTVAAPLYWLPRRTAHFLAERAPSGGESYITTALQRFLQNGGTVRAVHLHERLEVTTAEDLARVAELVL